MSLQACRTRARTDAGGEPVLLDQQDRSRWDAGQITQGLQSLARAEALSSQPGPYQLQAAIAACHATAPSVAETDWPQIVGLYTELARLAPGPVVELNRAVAIGEADGPAVALPLVEALAAGGRLDGYHLLHATRADLLRRAGRPQEAAASYRAALDLAPTEAEGRFLRRRLAALLP